MANLSRGKSRFFCCQKFPDFQKRELRNLNEKSARAKESGFSFCNCYVEDAWGKLTTEKQKELICKAMGLV